MIINFKVSVQVLPQMAPPCLSKTWQTIYRWIPLFRLLLIGPWPKKQVVAAEF